MAAHTTSHDTTAYTAHPAHVAHNNSHNHNVHDDNLASQETMHEVDFGNGTAHDMNEPFDYHVFPENWPDPLRRENLHTFNDNNETQHYMEPREGPYDYEEEEEDEEDEDEEDFEEEEEDDAASSEDEMPDAEVQEDMEKLQAMPGFNKKYRLIKKIGEGTFSTVYKAEDVLYDQYANNWDVAIHQPLDSNWKPPSQCEPPRPNGRRHYVAIKKIYVTSSPQRILNEIEILKDLRDCPAVCPIITAFRNSDQVMAVLPYFRHADFRHYFRDMTISDTVIYLRALFTALAAIHREGILHRDIKPTNFLYDPDHKRGVLVDFGLAERQGTDSKPCWCGQSREYRRMRLPGFSGYRVLSVDSSQIGYPKTDTRPSRRANRAGTRGFRAPEVLYKCTSQTDRIDVWSAGVILLTIMSKRFPFFNSADDVDALIEMSTLFGRRKMQQAGLVHGVVFKTSIDTITSQGFKLTKIIQWSQGRDNKENPQPLVGEELEAIQFLDELLDVDSTTRISAGAALNHPFLRDPACDPSQPPQQSPQDHPHPNSKEEAYQKLQRVHEDHTKWQKKQ